MKLSVRELKPALWPDLEQLFGEKGACGGCWCMFWRQKKGHDWAKRKGADNRRLFKELVVSGKAHGGLAYADGEPVGWVSFDRRVDYEKLDRAPSLKCEDAEKVWSIPCFYIRAGFRGQGVATALLAFAVSRLKKSGARIVEGYPVKARKSDGKIPAAFAWTGTVPLFESAKFKLVGDREAGKQRMRRSL
jgi:GNAT superfamily N-acetyltransferase